jgi:hypothetical protein
MRAIPAGSGRRCSRFRTGCCHQVELLLAQQITDVAVANPMVPAGSNDRTQSVTKMIFVMAGSPLNLEVCSG